MNLIVLENWLERKLRAYFSPLSDIIAAKDTSPIIPKSKKRIKNFKKKSIFCKKKDDNITRQTMKEERVKIFNVGYVQNSIS